MAVSKLIVDQGVFIIIASLACLLLLFACTTDLPEAVELAYQELPDEIDYNYDVKPILSDKCYACHGPDENKRKAGLRLDLKKNAFGRLSKSGQAAIAPHQSRKSPLVSRILSDDAAVMMPPPESHLSLNTKEKAILIKWIEEGAAYKAHWSFIPPQAPTIPQQFPSEWGQNPIDYFVLNKLTKAGLKPSDKASKESLVRRVSFDLTGLPPSLKTIEDFVRDESEDAYEKLVDRLLASPAYGERMAMDWMDVARYADSDGYLDDKHRDFTPWRDWVILAFNENMPYDQFSTWQLAGDLIPGQSKESTLATAFNRLHRRNSEAGIVFEEFRVEHVADRTLTMGKAFLGLTLECARCHDHKYDPISQEAYYQLFGFFNSTHEIGTAVYGPDQTPGPSLLLSNEKEDEIIEFLKKEIKEKEAQFAAIPNLENEDFQTWAANPEQLFHALEAGQSFGLIAHYSFDTIHQKKEINYLSPEQTGKEKPAEIKEPKIKKGKLGNALFINDYTFLKLPEKVGWFTRNEPFSISFSIFPDTVYTKEVGVFYHCEELRLGLKGYSLFLENNQLKFIISHSWPQNAIQVVSQEALLQKKWTDITITYDGSSKANGIHIYLDGVPATLTVDFDNLYKSIAFEYNIHTYGFSGFQIGHRNKFETFKKGGFDELKIFDRSLSALEVLYQQDSANVRTLIARSEKAFITPLLNQYYFQQIDEESVQLRQSLQDSRVALSTLR